MGIAQHRPALPFGPFRESLGLRTKGLAGPLVDRAADGVFPLEAASSFKDQCVGGPTNDVGGRVAVRQEPEFLLVIEKRAPPKLTKRVRGYEVPAPRMVDIGGLANEEAKVEARVGSVHNRVSGGFWFPLLSGRCRVRIGGQEHLAAHMVITRRGPSLSKLLKDI